MPFLYIIATPIGNLQDISLRAVETLRGVDFVLCEDSRQAHKLLSHLEIQKSLISYHQHSKINKTNQIIDLLKQGKNLALISDAGTPGISDPGGKLIELIVKEFGQEIKIEPIPGPCALTAALSVCGFSADKFLFLGFPPSKKGRRKFFTEIHQAQYSVVFYESCHRVLKTLRQLDLIASEHCQLDKEAMSVVVCRELTKKFETIYRGTIEEVAKQIENDKVGDRIKGEFVIVVKN